MVSTKLTPFSHGNHADADHAQPDQLAAAEPRRRPSLRPIMDQVRSMLHAKHASPTSSSAPASQPKWDAYTGELSETGQPSRVQPSTYVEPQDDSIATTAPRLLPSRTPPRLSGPSFGPSDASSPVSVVREDSGPRDSDNWSPVSPLDEASLDHSLVPEPLSPRVLPLQPKAPASTNATSPIKRKPAPRSASASENIPPPEDSPTLPEDPIRTPPKSQFSWATYTPSAAALVQPPSRSSSLPASREGTRSSLDTMASLHTKPANGDDQPGKSHFSWSTAATGATAGLRGRLDSPPSTPLPAVPDLPLPSIISRSRPIQRQVREDWAPPKRDRKVSAPTGTPSSPVAIHIDPIRPRKTSVSNRSPRSSGHSPSSTIGINIPAGTGRSKALPPPPTLAPSAVETQTHLETLLKQEQDLAVQRRNAERAVAELERFEIASPMAVSWASLRDARDRLQRTRARQAEILWEERAVGVAISRARRKEGAEEGLWVRRVTH